MYIYNNYGWIIVEETRHARNKDSKKYKEPFIRGKNRTNINVFVFCAGIIKSVLMSTENVAKRKTSTFPGNVNPRRVIKRNKFKLEQKRRRLLNIVGNGRKFMYFPKYNARIIFVLYGVVKVALSSTLKKYIFGDRNENFPSPRYSVINYARQFVFFLRRRGWLNMRSALNVPRRQNNILFRARRSALFKR